MNDLSHPVDGGFGLYLHWPFCQSKCPYCDFNSHVAARIDYDQWQTAYLSEIDRLGRETGDRILRSVFFGGGTPSLMPAKVVSAILDRVRSTWRMSNEAEITIEANPGSVEADRFSAYAEAGVNRVSIGVQALNDEALRQLGRMHSTEEALRALEIAKKTFSRVNFDLIYARQGQSLEAWRSELAQALQFGPTHLSLYQLTVEEGTVFHERSLRGQLKGLPDEDLAADMYELTQAMCEDAGLPAYEVSNHAAPGDESRHNLTYWHGGDYIGIGPGAHGRLTLSGGRFATECPKAPNRWLTQVRENGTGELPRSRMSADDIASEYLMMGLRLRNGISLGRLEEIRGRGLTTQSLGPLLTEGLLVHDGDRLATTRSGMLVLNAVLGALVAD